MSNESGTAWRKVLQAIRPCRESKTGWTPAPGNWPRRNQSSWKLNEHGPVLNVFWSRRSGMGAQVDRKKDQDKDGEAYKKRQKEFSRSGARTRWVTERIASLRKNRRHRSGINRRNDRFEWCRAKRIP